MYKLSRKFATEKYWVFMGYGNDVDSLWAWANVHNDCNPGLYEYKITDATS